MSIYSDKLAHVQVVINCRYSVAQLCTREDRLAYILERSSIDDVMSYLSRKVSTQTGRYQLPIFRCTIVLSIDDVMSYNLLTTF